MKLASRHLATTSRAGAGGTQGKENVVSSHTATVETLTAEVRVLMVGSRQVTISVAKQLDKCPWDDMEVFGRVRLGHAMQLIGRLHETGALVIADMPMLWGLPWIDADESLVVCSAIPGGDGGYCLTLDGRDFEVTVKGVRKCGIEGHSWLGANRCSGWGASDDLKKSIVRQLAEFDGYRARGKATANAPLIVLAGLR